MVFKLFNKKTYLYIFIIPTIIIFFNGIMLLFPKEIVNGAKAGLLLWFNKVVPSLLPFMILTNILILLNFPMVLGKILKNTAKIFKLSGVALFPIITGMISGYPVGVKNTVDLYKRNLIDKAEAYRLFTFVNNSGPLFILGTVGVGMLNSEKMGYLLLIVHYLSSFIILLLTGIFTRTKENKKPLLIYTPNISLGKLIGDGVMMSLNTILLIGGYIILFSVINVIILKTGMLIPICKTLVRLGLEERQAVGVGLGTIEITNGCSILSEKINQLTFPLCGFLISWGGFSIHAQTISIIGETDISPKPYILGKLCHGVISLIICAVVMKIWGYNGL